MKRDSTTALAALATVVPTLAQPTATDKPNVVIIVADDLGWGDLSAYGNTTIHPPNLDRLAH